MKVRIVNGKVFSEGAVFNLVHASETEAEAKHEMKHWFGKAVIHDYSRTDDEVFK